jgi:hypothetical protein
MPSSGMLRCVALVRTDVLEEPSASIIRVTRIGALGTMLAVTSNQRMLRELQSEKGSVKWNTRLGMQRGVGVAGSGHGFVNGQITK